MVRRFFLALALLLGAIGATHAQDFQLPGVQADADAYTAALTARYPAGGTPQLRRQAEAQAADALRRKDWAAAATALETRVAAGEPTPDQWLQLAQAQLRRTPPDPRKALAAAWENFQAVDTGRPEIPALLAMTEALRLLDRPAQMVQTLEAVLQRAPDDPDYRRMLADARRATGLLVKAVRTEPDADPPRACLDFTVSPVRRDDFHPQDWVRLDPPVAGAAVTREGDQICVSGLPSGATTRLLLRAGLPGEDGLSLVKATTVPVAMANRAPRIVFDARYFVLPRFQAPKLGVTTVNISALRLKLVRLTERNTVGFTAENPLGTPTDPDAADSLAGRTVWEARLDVPDWQPNRLMRLALPLPDALQSAGPGLFALIAQPGDGTPGGAPGQRAVQMILRTDLAPTVWRGADGLIVQIRGFADARPKPGVRLDLLAHDNDVLAQATTDADGVARFAAPLLHGAGPLAAQAVQAFGPDEDFTTIDLTTAAFDLSDRGVEGQPDPGPQDAYAWTDRGIYRPGETVHLMALLRDAAGNPLGIPAHVRVLRPNGQTYLETAVPAQAEGAIHIDVALSPSAPAGSWTAEVRGDPDAKDPIGTAGFRVDAFVPDRMAVDLGPAKGSIVAGAPYDLPVIARFLYGAPGAGLSGKATLRLAIDDAPFPALAGYRIGLQNETYAPDDRDLDLPDTDAQGHATLRIALARVPDTTHPLKAEIEVTVDDPSGRGVRAQTAIPVRPPGHLIGVREAFAGGAVDAGGEAAFDIVAVDPDGARTAVQARLRLVRERPDWRLVFDGRLAKYETVWRDEPLETADISIPADAPFRYAKRLDFGLYRLEVTEAGGLAATSVRFRSGWATSENPDVPDKADLSADRRAYAPGDTAHLHIAAPFDGEATVLIAGSKVFSLRTLSLAGRGTDIDVPVDAAWGPGAYAVVHVFRPGQRTDDPSARPARAIGVAWIGIDPATRQLDVKLDVQDRYAPRGRAVIPVHTAPGAWISLAAVDEGVLRLTSFASPDPRPHFLGRRALGLDIRDDWGRLIAPPDGSAVPLRQGGDSGSFSLPEIPQKVVALFTPPVQAGADGVAQIPLDLPDFNGQIRLMAVAWQANRVGAGEADIITRDPLVAEALLPRFLAPGDQARLAVLLHDLDLPAGAAGVDIATDGPLQIQGPTHLAADLAVGLPSLQYTTLAATGAGRGVIRLDVTGPAGFRVSHASTIIVRPSRGPVVTASGGALAPGAEVALSPQPERYIAGTWTASASFGAAVRYDPAALVQALDGYPLNCLEQATSKGLPLAVLPDGPAAGGDRAGRLQRAVQSVLDRQRYDGGFGLWSASDDAAPWLSAYATDFLMRARDAGAAVPGPALNDAVSFLGQAADDDDAVYDGSAKPEDMAAAVYRLYDLGRAGRGRPGAARVLAEHLDRLPTPLARAQLAAALALAHDAPRAQTAFAAALDAPARSFWYADYGSALRDQAAIAVLLKESGLLPDRLAALVAALPGPDLDPRALDTQEQAWAGAAAAALGRDGRPTRVALDGQAQPPQPVLTVSLTAPVQARNLADQPVWQSLAVSGVPRDPPPAARSQMRISRRFYALDGTALDLDHLRQNTVFILELEGRADDGQEHHAMVLHGLPAGWEVAGKFGSGTPPGLAWLGDLSDTEAQPAADDRFAAVVGLDAEHPAFRLAVRLRAVTPGTFELPGAEVADMYRPAIYARQAAGRISVQPAE